MRVFPNTPGGLGGNGKPAADRAAGPRIQRDRGSSPSASIAKSAENPNLFNLETDFQERQPQLRVGVDRNKAADLGVSLSNIGRALETMLGSASSPRS